MRVTGDKWSSKKASIESALASCGFENNFKDAHFDKKPNYIWFKVPKKK